MKNLIMIFLFLFCCSKKDDPQLFTINVIQDTCDMYVPLRLQEGKLIVVEAKLYIETSKDFPVYRGWSLNHTKLTMQDIAKDYYLPPGNFTINIFKEHTNLVLQKNVHPTLDKQQIEHDKIFPMLKVLEIRVIPYQKLNEIDYSRIYE